MRYIIITLILLTLFVGCGTSGPEISDTKLQTGTKGLTITFLDRNIPDETYEDSSFFLPIELQNEGFSDIEEGVFTLQYIEEDLELVNWELPEEFRILSDDNRIVSFTLDGKSLHNTKGQKQYINARLNTKPVYDTIKEKESVIRLDACYVYKTVASESICIDTNPSGVSVLEKTCDAKDLTFSGGQGAPVAITKIEQIIIPSENNQDVSIRFMISVENKGGGRIISKDAYIENCMGRSLVSEGNVEISRIEFSDYYYYKGERSDFKCEEVEQARGGPIKFRCELLQPIPKSKVTFQSPITVELSYAYKQTSKPVYVSILNSDQ